MRTKSTYEQLRKPGRPALRKDKHGRPVPVRADRDQPVRWFFEVVPRDMLEEALQLSGNPKFYRLYDAFQDPAYRNTSPMTLCRKFGISLLDVMELWKEYNVCLGMLRISHHLPEIMVQTVDDALRRKMCCPKCGGSGMVRDSDSMQVQCEMEADGSQTPKMGTCPQCKGLKAVEAVSDKDARRLVFEIFGLSGRNKAPIVAE